MSSRLRTASPCALFNTDSSGLLAAPACPVKRVHLFAERLVPVETSMALGHKSSRAADRMPARTGVGVDQMKTKSGNSLPAVGGTLPKP